MTSDRKVALFSTDAAPALGLSQYGRTPAKVWAEKRGLVEPEDISGRPEVRAGLYLQPVIARMHQDDTGDTLKSLDKLVIMAQPRGFPMGSSFDFYNVTTNRLHEIKNFNDRRRKEFGEPGSGEMPQDVLIQCLHELAVYNFEKPPYGPAEACEVDVLFGGQERVVFVVPLDLEAIEILYQKEAEFWAKVQTGEPPEAQTPDDARAIFRKDDGSEKVATRDVSRACDALAQLVERIKADEAQQDSLKAFVQQYMGTASFLTDERGGKLATWKAGKAPERLDITRLRQELPEVAAQYSITGEAVRRFLLKT